jgi:hypothetical protein
MTHINKARWRELTVENRGRIALSARSHRLFGAAASFFRSERGFSVQGGPRPRGLTSGQEIDDNDRRRPFDAVNHKSRCFDVMKLFSTDGVRPLTAQAMN